MITAQIAKLESPRRLVFESEPIDEAGLRPDQLICETLVTVISPGTELAAYRGARPLRPGTSYPRLVGYCNVGRVVVAGEGVSDCRIGDRVLSFVSHRSHFVVARDDVLARIPVGIRSEDAACAYLFHLGYNAVLAAEARLGSTVVVLGMGVVGLCATAMAAEAGAKVFAISNHVVARESAKRFGAFDCYDREHLPSLLADLGPNRAQIVITTSNSWADWQHALELCGRRGTIVVMGFPGRDESSIPLNPLDSQHFYDRQIRIIAAGMSAERPDSRGFLPFNERDNLARILGWIEVGTLLPNSLLSGEFSWRDLEKAYRRLDQRDGSSMTFLLRWAAET
jgi:threonine dehydrogenase-like Zn-dependent dehydrogenase